MPYNLPLEILGLKLPTIDFQHGTKQITRPITDHPPLIQNTVWGAMATINILNPGSPLAPPLQIGGVKTLPSDGKAQMEKMGQYIYSMFQQSVGFLALQEVPDPKSPQFEHLIKELRRLDSGSKLIDVNALKSQWLKTGNHTFGTSILYNTNRFSIVQGATPALVNRASEYVLRDLSTKTLITVANIHGDFNQQQGTTNYINTFDGICLGDANLSQFNASVNTLVLQSADKPGVTVEGVLRHVNTFDVFQDTLSKKANPQFNPNTARIDKPPVKNTSTTVFQSVSIQVEPKKAVTLLTDFANYLKQNGNADLVDQKGFIQNVKLTTSGTHSNIAISNEGTCQAFKEYQQKLNKFQAKKQDIQNRFIQNLNDLKFKLQQNETAGTGAEQLYNKLLKIQKVFFDNLAPNTDCSQSLNDFYNICNSNADEVDKIMGHGWLYRAVEVVVKAIGALIVGIFGMGLGSVVGQGFANPDHRKAFSQTFFSWNENDSSKAVNEFRTSLKECKDEMENNISPFKNNMSCSD